MSINHANSRDDGGPPPPGEKEDIQDTESFCLRFMRKEEMKRCLWFVFEGRYFEFMYYPIQTHDAS